MKLLTASPRWNETASYAVVLAGILSLVARPYLGIDAVPLLGVGAHTARSGKSKIVEAICGAALGHKPTPAHFTDEIEFGKQLQPLMRAGDRAILLDNVERSVQSAKLCVLITQGLLRDRILGVSRDVVLKNYAVIFATGNNLVVGGDLAVRAIRADIDPQLERPESRAFTFDPVARAIERHPQLVVAALTALSAYVAKGMPWALERAPWGGFERWDQLISGCLSWLGYADPYATRDRVIGADPIRSGNGDLLENWFELYGEREVTFEDIRADDRSEVYQALLKDGHWNGHFARWILTRMEGQICGGLRLLKLEGRSRYKVVDEREGTQRGFSGTRQADGVGESSSVPRASSTDSETEKCASSPGVGDVPF